MPSSIGALGLVVLAARSGWCLGAPRLMRVLVLQDALRLNAWMYKPAYETLLAGLDEYAHRGALNVTAKRVSQLESAAEYAQLQAGDLFIWLGLAAQRHVPWLELRRRGVRTVYSRTEPNERCALVDSGIDEVWDYSHANVGRQRCTCGRRAAVSRYLPPGSPAAMRAHARASPGRRASASAVAAQATPPAARVSFLGLIFFPETSPRYRCVREIEAAMNASVAFISNVWTAPALARTVGEPGALFVSVHKLCAHGIPQPFEAFRAAQLLPHGALLVSERSDARDEKAFEGIVQFARADALGAVLADLARQSPEQRAERAAATAARFARRFDPRRLFEEARVYALLDAMLGIGASAAHVPSPCR